MNAAPIQPETPAAVTRPRAMLPLAAVASLLQCTPDHALKLAERGNVGVCFNLASDTARGKRFLRFPPSNVDELIAGRQPSLAFEDIMEMFCQGAEKIRAVEVYQWLSCGQHHFYRFARRGELLADAWRRGPLNSALVNCSSLAKFLKARLYPKAIA